MCVGGHIYAIELGWRSEDNFQEVIFFLQEVPGIELKSSCFAANAYVHQASFLDPKFLNPNPVTLCSLLQALVQDK